MVRPSKLSRCDITTNKGDLMVSSSSISGVTAIKGIEALSAGMEAFVSGGMGESIVVGLLAFAEAVEAPHDKIFSKRICALRFVEPRKYTLRYLGFYVDGNRPVRSQVIEVRRFACLDDLLWGVEFLSSVPLSQESSHFVDQLLYLPPFRPCLKPSKHLIPPSAAWPKRRDLRAWWCRP
jgi:hypothetical protein